MKRKVTNVIFFIDYTITASTDLIPKLKTATAFTAGITKIVVLHQNRHAGPHRSVTPSRIVEVVGLPD